MSTGLLTIWLLIQILQLLLRGYDKVTCRSAFMIPSDGKNIKEIKSIIGQAKTVYGVMVHILSNKWLLIRMSF